MKTGIKALICLGIWVFSATFVFIGLKLSDTLLELVIMPFLAFLGLNGCIAAICASVATIIVASVIFDDNDKQEEK